jgi:hypothetical protein
LYVAAFPEFRYKILLSVTMTAQLVRWRLAVFARPGGGVFAELNLLYLHRIVYIAPGYSKSAAGHKSTANQWNSWNICTCLLFGEVEQMGGRQRGSHG